MLCKIGVLEKFAIFTGKHPCWSLFKIKLQAWKPFLPKHHLFQELIYEIQNNLHQLTTHMLTLIMWDKRFSENENEAVEAHIPRHRDSKTKKPRYRDSKTKKPQHRDSKTKKPQHRETETNKPRHRDSKAFFQRTKSHDIEIPRPKSHDIEFLWNSDPYAPWYSSVVPSFSGCSVFRCSGVFRCSVVPRVFHVPSFRRSVFRCSWFYSMP